MRQILIALIRFYQRYISGHLPRSCIYHPSCSTYTMEMIQRHGVVRGVGGGILRVARCHGWFFRGGYDPALHAFSWRRLVQRYAFFWKWRRKKPGP